jgi:hypothetical protein
MAKAGIPIVADFPRFPQMAQLFFRLTEVTKVEPEKVVLPEKVVNKIEKKAVKSRLGRDEQS